MSQRRRRSCAPKEPSHAPPPKPRARSCAHDLSHPAPADPGGAGLAPCPSCPCGGGGATRLHRLRHLPLGACRPAPHGGSALPLKGRRASGSARAPVARPPARAPAHRLSTAAARQTPSRTARAPPRGAGAHGRPGWRHTPGARLGAHVAAWSAKTGAQLRPAHGAADAALGRRGLRV